ncbi:MAG: HNH endonuclease [Planctomycetota bacterium]
MARIVREKAWRVLGYRSLEEYCRERLGGSARSVRQRVWLERRMEALPELRDALTAGRLTYSKALLVAKDATPGTAADRIREAAATTWQQLERESTAREELRNRAAGVRRLWGPQDAAQTVVDAITSAQAWSKTARGEDIDAGEALAVVADHFVAVWTEHLPRRRMPKERRQVLMRHGGLCAVPGCSRPAEHVHHVTFRSRGGSDDPANEVAVCAVHHLHGIHRGYLTVAGRAGERLVWRLGTSEAVPLEEWVTEGDDDVRRANGEARSGAAPPGAARATAPGVGRPTAPEVV